MENITTDRVKSALGHLGSAATLYEICQIMDLSKSWEREEVLKIVNRKGFMKVPVESLCRNFATLNPGRTKWAYKVN